MKGLLNARLLAVVVCAVLLAGCASRYKITLTNGNLITTRGKPKLDAENDVYRYKDIHGNPAFVPAFRVRQIEPL